MRFSLAEEKSIDELIDEAAEIVAKKAKHGKQSSIDELVDKAAEIVAEKQKKKPAS